MQVPYHDDNSCCGGGWRRRETNNDNTMIVLAQELQAMTVQQREKIFAEAHGVADIIEESPEFVTERLIALRKYISSEIPTKNKKALERAIFLRPSIEWDDKFHLMCLRARQFDIKCAGVLVVNYFENKLMLFGDELLPKRITLDCLTPEEISFLKGGSNQILKRIESRGRGVNVSHLAMYDLRDWKAYTRAAWYNVMTTIEEDEELQRRGVVQVAIMYGNFRHTPAQMMDFLWKTENVHKMWPFHTNCIHVCYDNPLLTAFMRACYTIQTHDLRVRLKAHYGSSQEAQYEMLTYGLDVSDCFTEGRGVLSPEFTGEYLRERRRIDDEWNAKEKVFEHPTSTFALYPNQNDVLMGRGKYREWPGNQRFSKLVALFAPRYIDADGKDRIEKTVIALDIIHRLELEGVRFLQRTEHGWAVVDDATIKDKVSHSLRTQVKQLVKTANKH